MLDIACDAFEDAVLGFVLVDEVVEDGRRQSRFAGTNWPTHGSFPMFVLNVLDYLGGNRQGARNGVDQARSVGQT